MKKIVFATNNAHKLQELRQMIGSQYEVLGISGPLFFASAERTFRKIRHDCLNRQKLILDFTAMNMLDAGGDHCLDQFCNDMKKRGVDLMICGVQYQPMRCMVKSSFASKHPEVRFTSTLEEALELASETAKALAGNSAAQQK